MLFIVAAGGTGGERWRWPREPRPPALPEEGGRAPGAEHRVTPCPRQAGRGQPLPNDAAQTDVPTLREPHRCTALPLHVLPAEPRRFSERRGA